MSVLLDILVPVFSIVALGALLSRRGGMDLATLSELALLVTSPALLFGLLLRADLAPERLAGLGGGVLFVVAGTGALALGYARLRGPGASGVLLPAMLWNAGNLALPVCRLAYGEQGLSDAAVIFVLMATLQSSLGIAIAKGGGGIGEALRAPLLHAAVLGAICNLMELQPPAMLQEPIDMLGAMAIPLMLLTLGLQLPRLEVSDVGHAVAAVSIRMLGGGLLAWLYTLWLPLEGVARAVLITSAVMPAAVINIVIAQRYGRSPGTVASAIVLGTLLSLLVLPLVLYLLVD